MCQSKLYPIPFYHHHPIAQDDLSSPLTFWQMWHINDIQSGPLTFWRTWHINDIDEPYLVLVTKFRYHP